MRNLSANFPEQKTGFNHRAKQAAAAESGLCTQKPHKAQLFGSVVIIFHVSSYPAMREGAAAAFSARGHD